MERNFKGVWIPKDIYISKELSWSEKILLIEVYNLDNGEGCFASNKYLSEVLMLSEGSVANMIVKMINNGHIVKKGFDGRRRFIGLSDQLSNLFDQSSQNYETSLNKNINSESIKILNQASQNHEGSFNENINSESIKTLKQSSQNHDHNNINNNKENNKFNNLQKNKKDEYSKFFSEELNETIKKYFEYRVEIKKPFKSQKAIEGKLDQFLKQAKEYGEIAVIESINTAIANQYQGTFIDNQYLQKNKEKPLKDENGNYSNNKQGRELFISNIRARSGNIFLQEE